MRRGTTPTFQFSIDFDLTDWDVYVTFTQGSNRLLTRKDAVIAATEDGCTVTVELTQEETLAFKVGKASAQVRAEKNDGADAVATTIFDFTVGDILLNGEIPQEV